MADNSAALDDTSERVLLMVKLLRAEGKEAFSRSIREGLEARTGQRMSVGRVQARITQLLEWNYLRVVQVQHARERRGRPRKVVCVTEDGTAALVRTARAEAQRRELRRDAGLQGVEGSGVIVAW